MKNLRDVTNFHVILNSCQISPKVKIKVDWEVLPWVKVFKELEGSQKSFDTSGEMSWSQWEINVGKRSLHILQTQEEF